MRGKGRAAVENMPDFGITPAYAGKSIYHVRQRLSANGSPPPMRGKGVAVVDDLKGGGITPAYAGKRPAKFSAIIFK